MKIFTICVMTLALAFAGCAGESNSNREDQNAPADNRENPRDNANQNDQPDTNMEAIKITLSPARMEAGNVQKASLKVENNTDDLITYGEHYWIERENKGEWVRDEELSKVAFNDIGIELDGNKSTDMEIYFARHATFDPGNYRLCKEFDNSNGRQTACAHFTIE